MSSWMKNSEHLRNSLKFTIPRIVFLTDLTIFLSNW